MSLNVRYVGKLRGEDAMSLPCTGVTFDALRFIADQLGVSVCFYYRNAFHFELGRAGVTLAVKPDSAGRLRISVCQYAAEVSTKWVSTTDRARQAQLVAEATEVMMNGANPCAHDPARARA